MYDKNYKNFTIVSDLDGTLTRTDTLLESVLLLIKSSPPTLFLLPLWLIKGRAFLKDMVASKVSLPIKTLPYNEELLAYIKDQKKLGRKIVLATAAHTSIAEAVAEHLGLFDDVIASTKNVNLKGKTKLRSIIEKVGYNYVYAGDSNADLPIWNSSKAAILVDVNTSLTKKIDSSIPVEKKIEKKKNSLLLWVKALRVYQWLKNLLIFVPLFTGFSFMESDKILLALMAFFAFSFLASGTYVFNDLWDLSSDRAHPRKKNRVFASSLVPMTKGIIVALLAMAIGLITGWFISNDFFIILVIYLLLTSSYSLFLKNYVLIDVILLSLLYTIRIVAGAISINEEISEWLLAFSVFIFISLALVKRCSELQSLKKQNIYFSRGRDYRVSDLVILWPLGISSALASIVVFGLFISAEETQTRYETSEVLWFAALGITYWLSRLWIKTARNEMHDDPIIYSLTNRGSLTTIFILCVIIIIAHFFQIRTFI